MKLRWRRNPSGTEWWTVLVNEVLYTLDSGPVPKWVWRLWYKVNPESL